MELQHHGIKGQKWGIRRFQNEDGSLIKKGKLRYDDISNKIKFSAESAKNKAIRVKDNVQVSDKAKKHAIRGIAGIGASIALKTLSNAAFVKLATSGHQKAAFNLSRIGSLSSKSAKIYGLAELGMAAYNVARDTEKKLNS